MRAASVPGCRKFTASALAGLIKAGKYLRGGNSDRIWIIKQPTRIDQTSWPVLFPRAPQISVQSSAPKAKAKQTQEKETETTTEKYTE